MIIVAIITSIPVLGATWAILATSEAELSDLVPSKKGDGYTLVGWRDLLRNESSGLESQATVHSGTAVQVLGYMVAADSRSANEELVHEFILLPDAGNLLHPAHRFGDQMIAVHLQPSDPIKFATRSLVWASGRLRTETGNPVGPKPLYHLDAARAKTARRDEIPKFFK